MKKLMILMTAIALLAPAQAAAIEGGDYGAPRAMPSDYTAAGVPEWRSAGIPRAMPSDYAAYFASVEEPVPADGFDWVAAGIGAGSALGAVIFAAFAARLVRRGAHLRTA